MKIINVTFKGVSKDVKFTDPQARVMERLLRGEKVTMINTHWMSGGEFVWYQPDGNYSWGKEYVGWRAYQGAMRTVEKAFNLKGEDADEWWNRFQAKEFLV